MTLTTHNFSYLSLPLLKHEIDFFGHVLKAGMTKVHPNV